MYPYGYAFFSIFDFYIIYYVKLDLKKNGLRKKRYMKDNKKSSSGIILIDKPEGITSNDVLFKLKKIEKNKYGHTGTLDPLATGLLVVLIGNATKLSKYLLKQDKEYVAEILLGKETDSLDITGSVIKEDKDIDKKMDTFNKENILNVLNEFKGSIKQIPPIYSALKLDGKKLYEIARDKNTSDKEIEAIIKSKEREIYISDISLLDINEENKTISIKVKCSSGTYIRSLARDIALKLDTYGCIKALRRTKVGNFKVEDASFENILDEEEVLKDIFKEKIYLEDKRVDHFINGVMCSVKKDDGMYMVYNKETKEFIGLGEVRNFLVKRKYIKE